MNQDKKKFDNNEDTRMDGFKGLMALTFFPITAVLTLCDDKMKEAKAKQNSDALSTCGCLIVFIAIILLIAVCAA